MIRMFWHFFALFLSTFKKRPNVRRSAWIAPRAMVPNDAVIGERVKIKGNVQIGRGVFINDDAVVWGGENGVVIGDFVRIYTKVMVDSGNHCGKDWDYVNAVSEKVVVGDFAVLDNSCVVCKGVSVGRGAIVSSGAVVTEDVPEFAVVAGNPARVVGDRKNGDLCRKT